MSRERERTSSSVPSAARIASPVNGARSSTSRSVVIAFESSERGVDWTYKVDNPSLRLIDDEPEHGCEHHGGTHERDTITVRHVDDRRRIGGADQTRKLVGRDRSEG